MPIYITITGQNHYFGILPFSIGTKLMLVRDNENPYDSSAISVQHTLYGKVGYVANRAETIAVGTSSADTVCSLLTEDTFAIVRFIAGDYILCEVLL